MKIQLKTCTKRNIKTITINMKNLIPLSTKLFLSIFLFICFTEVSYAQNVSKVPEKETTLVKDKNATTFIPLQETPENIDSQKPSNSNKKTNKNNSANKAQPQISDEKKKKGTK